tara:strand:+ start:71 stop:283 length:213 start_codon:yes stop_codon:yes gene_type:complete
MRWFTSKAFLKSNNIIVNTCGFLSQVVCGYFGMRREVVFANCECRLPEIMLFQNKKNYVSQVASGFLPVR